LLLPNRAGKRLTSRRQCAGTWTCSVHREQRLFSVSRPDLRSIFWFYFLSIRVPAFSGLSRRTCPSRRTPSVCAWRAPCGSWRTSPSAHHSPFPRPRRDQLRTFGGGAVVLLQRLGLLLHLCALFFLGLACAAVFSAAFFSWPAFCSWALPLASMALPSFWTAFSAAFPVAVMASRADNEAPRKKF